MGWRYRRVGNDLDVRQKCSFSSCNDNDFQLHVWGDSNDVIFGQGYENNNSLTPNWNYDGTEPGGNFVRLDIHGDNNTCLLYTSDAADE